MDVRAIKLMELMELIGLIEPLEIKGAARKSS
jgi:hypothetical protein